MPSCWSKKAACGWGGLGSQTIKANVTVFAILDFGVSIPAQTTRYGFADIAAVVGDACYASPHGAVGVAIGYCGCKIVTPNIAEICIINPTPAPVGISAVGWRVVVFNY